jgi:hypothetical protein
MVGVVFSKMAYQLPNVAPFPLHAQRSVSLRFPVGVGARDKAREARKAVRPSAFLYNSFKTLKVSNSALASRYEYARGSG